MDSIDDDERVLTDEDLYRRILMCLASLAGEEKILNLRSIGGGGDLEQASKTALAMVGGLGLGKRLISVHATGGNYSERDIAEADRILQAVFEFAKEYVVHYKVAVDAVAKALDEQTDLIGPDVTKIVLGALADNNLSILYPSIMAQIKPIIARMEDEEREGKLAESK